MTTFIPVSWVNFVNMLKDSNNQEAVRVAESKVIEFNQADSHERLQFLFDIYDANGKFPKFLAYISRSVRVL